MRLRGWLEITMSGSSSWMNYALQGVKEFDDDDDDDMEVSGQLCVPWEESPQYPLNKIWVCSRDSLCFLGKTQISCFVPAIKPQSFSS